MTKVNFINNIHPNTPRCTVSPDSGNEDKSINNNIANISCTIKIPIVSFPNTSSNNHLSPNNFTIIIVLLNDNAIPINILVINEYHKPRDNIHPNSIVSPTCDNPINKAGLPISLISLVFNPIPTIKRSNATQRCENIATPVVSCNTHSICGPTISPVIIYPIINGCLRTFIT